MVRVRTCEDRLKYTNPPLVLSSPAALTGTPRWPPSTRPRAPASDPVVILSLARGGASSSGQNVDHLRSITSECAPFRGKSKRNECSGGNTVERKEESVAACLSPPSVPSSNTSSHHCSSNLQHR